VIRVANTKDFQAIADIYNYYIRDTVISFEEIEIDDKEIERRVKKIETAGLYWLVFVEASKVIGYAYASRWNERSAYNRTVEISVYLDHQALAKGYGSKLYSELFDLLKKKSIHTIIAGVALPNEASVKLHEKFGMKKVAHFSEVGFKFGKWIDVGYWQVQLNT